MIRPGIKRLFALALRRRDAARDVDDEVRTHLELRAERLMREGWSAEAAHREALRRFGSMSDAQRQLHTTAVQRDQRMRTREWMADAWQDLRHGVRSLAREPGLSTFVIATLALGVGANATMFGVVDRLLLHAPDHIRDAAQVKRIQYAFRPPGMDLHRSGTFGYVSYDLLHRNAKSFDAVAAYSISPNGAIYGRGADAYRINRGDATASLFPLLGVRAEVGRFFDEKEDDVIAPVRVTVIGYGLWQSKFAGARDVVGKTIILDNATYTVIGVAPRGFTGPELTRVDVWMPESLESHSSNWTQTWNSRWLGVMVRLKDGVSDAQANAEITALHRGARAQADPSILKTTYTVRSVNTTREGDERTEARVSKWLLAVAIIVLLIACANVVNLLLARTLRRRREIAMRLTLGAGRARLIRLLVLEAMALAAAGAVAGFVLARLMGSAMRTVLIPDVEWTSGVADVRVLGVSAAIAIIAGLAVGLVPALQASTPDLASALKAGVREGGGRRNRLRATLTVAQAALSVVLLVGAGLFVKSLHRARSLDLGLQPDRVLSFSVARAGMGAIADTAERRRERERRAAFYPLVVEQLRARPDVESASLTIGLAFSSGFGEDIRVPGRDSIPRLKGGGPYLSAVTADFFTTVGTRILRGRPFTDADHAGTAPVAIVNETMAATLWPNENPIGQCFYVGQSKACAEIVGIAANSHRWTLREQDALSFYIPFGQEQGLGGTRLLVRPRGDTRSAVAEIRKTLIALDPSITFVYADLLQDRLEPQFRPWQLGATMFSLMGVLALIVASIGLYSLISYLVANRRHEIGVRIALGAQSRDIIRLILSSGVGLSLAGVGAGLALAFATTRFIEPLLFDTKATDPVVFGVVAAVLLAVAIAASAIPAWRARAVNPMEAMRVE